MACGSLGCAEGWSSADAGTASMTRPRQVSRMQVDRIEASYWWVDADMRGTAARGCTGLGRPSGTARRRASARRTGHPRPAYVPPLSTPEQPLPDPLPTHDRCHARLADTHVGGGCATVMACQPPDAEGKRAPHQGQDDTAAFDPPDARRTTLILSAAHPSLHRRCRGAAEPVTHA